MPEEEIGDWPVWLQGSEGAIGLRLIAWRMPAAEARRAQEQTRRRATRKGQRIRPETLEAVGYVFLLTTLAEVDATTVLALYRTRWQIELAFKRLKSLLQVGQLKKTDAGSAQAWLQGKLLLACLVEKMIAAGALFSPARKGADAPLHMAGNAVDVRRAGAGNSARLVIAAHP